MSRSSQEPASTVADTRALMEDLHTPELLELPEIDADGAPRVLVLPRGMEARSIKPLIDEYRERPERRVVEGMQGYVAGEQPQHRQGQHAVPAHARQRGSKPHAEGQEQQALQGPGQRDPVRHAGE